MAQKPKSTDYQSYLRLDKLLTAQEPESVKRGTPSHDETLFIIVHQVFELWFKQVLFELDSIREIFSNVPVDERAIGLTVARMQRIELIQNIMRDQFKVMETMTPLDFLDFRGYLERASGFQSYQFRILENKLGLDPTKRVQYAGKPYHHGFEGESLEAILLSEREPSLFQLIENWLERTPFLDLESFKFVPEFKRAYEAMLAADREKIEALDGPPIARAAQIKFLDESQANYESVINAELHQEQVARGLRRLSYKATIAALFINLYRDEPILHLSFKLLQSLVDLDEDLALWRYQHALMVLRMLGKKIGTGQSSGYDYLRSSVESTRIFGDLANLSTVLIPRTYLPKLPTDVMRRLSFVYSAEQCA